MLIKITNETDPGYDCNHNNNHSNNVMIMTISMTLL